jgi:hypothetical protein
LGRKDVENLAKIIGAALGVKGVESAWTKIHLLTLAPGMISGSSLIGQCGRPVFAPDGGIGRLRLIQVNKSVRPCV